MDAVNMVAADFPMRTVRGTSGAAQRRIVSAEVPERPVDPGTDQVTLSAKAQRHLGAAGAAPGKSALSPAKVARAEIEAAPSLAAQPFGKIVSMIARGIALTSETPAASPDTQTETPEAGEVPVAEDRETAPSQDANDEQLWNAEAVPADPDQPADAAVDLMTEVLDDEEPDAG